MAKKLIVCCLLISMVLGIASIGYCQDYTKKLGRGLANLITFPLEIPEQISRVNNSEGPTSAATYGLLKGISMMIVRAAAGVYEIITFPVPIPKDYKPLLTDPEFLLDNMNW